VKGKNEFFSFLSVLKIFATDYTDLHGYKRKSIAFNLPSLPFPLYSYFF